MSAVSTYTEEELILLLKEQSLPAFNYLYKQYAGALYGVIYKLTDDEQTSEDVLQEAFLKIWNNIDQYNARRGRLFTWMLNIARNSAIDKLRSKGEIMKTKINTSENAIDSLEQQNSTEQSTDTIGLRKMVEGLRPEQAVIINLAYFNGYTSEEIAKALNIPVGTVKTRMRSAIGKLREAFATKQ